jgi:Mrp family chromosome partitioning ATPase
VDFLDYLRIFRRRWRLVAAVVAAAAVAALVTMPESPDPTTPRGSSGPTSYTATTTLLRTSTSTGDLPMSTLPIFVATGDVPAAAARKIGFEGDPNLLGGQVSVRITEDNATVGITARGTDPELAARTADAFAESLIDFLRERARKAARSRIATLKEQLVANREEAAAVTGSDVAADAERDGLNSAYAAIQQAITDLQVQSATAGFNYQVLMAASPVPVIKARAGGGSGGVVGSGDSAVRHTLLLVVVGLALGLGLALVVERVDTRVRGRSQFEDALRLPVVASVPQLPRRERQRFEVVSHTAPHSPMAESFRSLRSALLLLPSRPVPLDYSVDRLLVEPMDESTSAPVSNPRVVLATSARGGEGKTTCLVNLACALAESGRRVILLDCDFRHPEAHLYLGVPQGRGLSDLLAANQGHPLESVLQQTDVPNVRLATAGFSTEHPGALLGTMGPLIQQARGLADVVLIDAPPVLLANDAIDVMPFVDTVVVVSRDGRVSGPEAAQMMHLLTRLRVACLGTVLVGATDAGASYFKQEETLRSRRWRREKTHRSTVTVASHRATPGGRGHAGNDNSA